MISHGADSLRIGIISNGRCSSVGAFSFDIVSYFFLMCQYLNEGERERERERGKPSRITTHFSVDTTDNGARA